MPNLLIVEDDPFLRIVQLVLDPNASRERLAAFADFFAMTSGFCRLVREGAAESRRPLSAEVRLVETQRSLRSNLADANGLIVESLTVVADELAAAPNLKAVQKYGVDVRRIDQAACAKTRRCSSQHPAPRQYRVR